MIGLNAKQSLINKDIKCCFDLEEDNSTGNLLFYNNNSILNIGNVLHSIKIMPSEKKIEVSFLKHKRQREKDEDEELTIVCKAGLLIQNNNNNNGMSSNVKTKIDFFKYIIEERKRFYSQPHICKYLDIQNYEELLSNFNGITDYTTQYSFCSFFNTHRPLSSIDISPNLLLTDEHNLSLITPNSLLHYISKTVENKFEKNETVFLTGEKGMGKTSALMLYSYLLRLNPYNLILSIFNCKQFLDQPANYLFNELLFGLTPLLMYHSDLNINSVISLYTDYNDLQLNSNTNNHYDKLKQFQQMCALFFYHIYRILVAYNREVTFYFIIDDYDELYNTGPEYIKIIKAQIETLKPNQWGLIDTRNIKSIFCSTNSSRTIINQIEELKGKASIENIIKDHIVYLKPQSIFQSEELYTHFKSKLKLKDEFKNSMLKIIYLANFNYSLINSLLKDPLLLPSFSENETKGKVKAMYLEDIDRQFEMMSNERRFELISQLYSYDKLNQIKEKCIYIFQTSNYANYNYSIVIPHVDVKNNSEIGFEFVNRIWEYVCNSFNHNQYYDRIDFGEFTLDYFRKTYESTKSKILQGIILEKMAYLFYFNALKLKGSIVQDIPILVFAKQGKDSPLPFSEQINSLTQIGDNNTIKVPIYTVGKSETFDQDSFKIELIPKLHNGIYFLSHKFPLIDAFIIDNIRKHIFLIQIKKQLNLEHINQTMKDFNILYLMMDNDTVADNINNYVNLYFQNERRKKFIKKIFVLNTIAQLARTKGYSFNYVFSYIGKQREINMNMTFTEANKLFIENNERKQNGFYVDNYLWKNCCELIGVYTYEKAHNFLKILKIKGMRNIIMCPLDNFVKGLDSDKDSWFANLID